MKRIRNFVIGGIENKIFNLILVTVVLLTAVFMAVSVYHTRMLTELSEESTQRHQEAIDGVTTGLMDAVLDQSMSRYTQLEAYIVNEKFQEVKNRVEMLGEYAGKLFADPQDYPRLPVEEPDLSKEGEVTTQLMLPEGVDPEDPEVQDRIGLAANLTYLMVSVFGSSEDTCNSYIALTDGSFLMTDDKPSTKFDEEGNLIPFDPRTRPWYQKAAEAGELIFTDVEIDAFNGEPEIVCAMPIYADGELVAVLGSDMYLTSMQDAVLNSETGGNFVFVVNHEGHVIFSPKTEGELSARTADESEDLRQTGNEVLSSFINDAMTGQTDMRTIDLSDGTYFMIGAPMETVGWILVNACDQARAYLPVSMLNDSYEQIQNETVDAYNIKTNQTRFIVRFLFIAAALLTLAGALTLGKKIVKPLNTITKRISQLSEREMEFKMEDAYRTGDEIEELAMCFARTSHKTIEYIQTVKRVTAEKERIGTELALATDIQAAMMPHIFPAFPDRPDFDIFASMNPAKEVGGDFYDYFLIDEDHLCMVIADVSGKGVPAALFMMASKIILQSMAMLGYSAGEILSRTNAALCSNNEAEMFVTVWLGILELSTGKITAANAGHEYPVLKYPGSSFELYKDRHGFVIGGFEGLRYREYELQITPGTRLFVYTDGVPEATNAYDEMFGTDRLIEALNKEPEAGPKELLTNVREAVDAFVMDAEQFDDLTMLCIEYYGPVKTEE